MRSPLALGYIGFQRPLFVAICDETLSGSGGNEYPTFAAAAKAATDASPGSLLLQRGDATARGAIDLTGVSVVGLGTITPTLTIADGCTLVDDLNDFSFENVSIVFGGATPVISVPVAATLTLERYASISMANTATAGFVEADGGILVDMNFANGIAGSSGHQAIKLGAAAYAQIRVGNFGSIASNTITGGSDGGIEITDLSKSGGGAAASISTSQTGTINPVFD